MLASDTHAKQPSLVDVVAVNASTRDRGHGDIVSTCLKPDRLQVESGLDVHDDRIGRIDRGEDRLW